jgi:uncharacterized protein GlcG (DUF336 family)
MRGMPPQAAVLEPAARLWRSFTTKRFQRIGIRRAASWYEGGQFFGIHASNDGRIMIFAGGVPLKRDGKVIGAIGVSGGSGERRRSWPA